MHLGTFIPLPIRELYSQLQRSKGPFTEEPSIPCRETTVYQWNILLVGFSSYAILSIGLFTFHRTFFGGEGISNDNSHSTNSYLGADESWATPNTTHTFFRNIQLWGGSAPSNLTGAQVGSGSGRTVTSGWTAVATLIILVMTLV